MYMTSQRKMLLDFLEKNHDKQFSATDIANALKNRGISISAVYRNLIKMHSQGIISRSVKEDSREIYYQYMSGCDCKNSIHLTCTKCGKVSHMDSAYANEMTANLRKSGFNLNKTKTIVVTGNANLL